MVSFTGLPASWLTVYIYFMRTVQASYQAQLNTEYAKQENVNKRAFESDVVCWFLIYKFAARALYTTTKTLRNIT